MRNRSSQILKRGKINGLRLAVILILCTLGSSLFFVISASGATAATLSINTSNVVGTNKLSLGFQLAGEVGTWTSRSTMQQQAKDANFKLIRLFSWKNDPCTSWNEATKTGTFYWADVDAEVQKIFAIGAEPLITIGYARPQNIWSYIPYGMSVNPNTGLPYPSSWAAYCREWVRHFSNMGLPIRYYETMNEPWLYFGWVDYTKLANFKTLFNAAASAMRSENPNILISFDGTNRKYVLDYWLANGGADLGFIAFHKYDAYAMWQYSDDELFNRAQTYQLTPTYDYYGIQDSRNKYYNSRGKWIPVINSESNLNSGWEDGTDPRIQQLVGSLWLALELRTEIMNGVDYNIYFNYASSGSWQRQSTTSGGVGFGMVNIDGNQPWYPYYVQKLIGSNLAVGDVIVESASSSSYITALSWVHQGSVKTLLICKSSTGSYGLSINGLQGTLTYSKIDGTYPWQYPQVQTGTLGSTSQLYINGYTIILLSSPSTAPTPTPTPPPPPPTPTGSMIFNDDFESGSFYEWSAETGNIGVTSGTWPGGRTGTDYVKGSITSAGESSRVLKNLGNTYSALYIRMYVRMEDLFTGGPQGLGPRFSNADNSAPLGYVLVDCANNKWGFKTLNPDLRSYFEPSSTMIIQPDRWYCIEFYMSIGWQGKCTLWVDGVQKLSGTFDNDAYGNVGYASAQAYCATSMTTTRTWYADSFVAATNYIGL